MEDSMNTLENLLATAPNLAFELPSGMSVVKLGVIATIYFKQSYTTAKKLKVMECYRAFYEEFGMHLKGHIQDGYQKLTPANFEKTVARIAKSGGHDQYEWQLTSAGSLEEAEAYGLSTLNSQELHGDTGISYLKIVLPWDFLQTDAGLERYNAWIAYLCNQVEADHGYGGLSTILPFDYDTYVSTEFALAQQYLGLEVDSAPHSLCLHLIDVIKGVNWQTVLGEVFVQRLGGETVLRQALGGRSDIHIQNFNAGLIIRAGDYPQLGARDQAPPAAYVAVNEVVKTLRIPEPVQLQSHSPYGPTFGEDTTAQWFKRFDKE
jgi:hypothetical protein